MIAETSRMAFSKVKLSKNEEVVYYTLNQMGVGTNDDIAKALNWPVHCVTGRVNSLWKKSLIYVVDHAGMTQMGNKANRWAIADPDYRQLSFIKEQDCEN